MRLTGPPGSRKESGFDPRGCYHQGFSCYSFPLSVECLSVCLVCVLWKYLLAANAITLQAKT